MPRGVWGLWLDVPEPTRSQLRTYYRILREEFDGLPSRAARTYAKTVSEIWLSTDSISTEAAKLASHRKHGRGRKPTSQKIRLLVKRQSMQAVSLDQALAKLRALATKPPLHAIRRRA
jgi:hypothetical protein